MKGYTKKDIMNMAWEMARLGAKRFGGKAKQYFTQSLKLVWGQIKKMVRVPSWFIAKKIYVRLGSQFERGFIQKETEKAVFVKIPAIGESFWCPKSILA